jgi:hypothetical protein
MYGKDSSLSSSRSHCIECPRGKFQSVAGKADCNDLKPGFWLTKTLKKTTGGMNTTAYDYEPQQCYDGDAVRCMEGEVRYSGGVWHDPNIEFPTTKTKMYTCVNNGCPSPGADEMVCTEGYNGPLCAVCDQGYFK